MSTTTAPPLAFSCTEWCTGHDADIYDGEKGDGKLHVLHGGPEFGAFCTSLEVIVTTDGMESHLRALPPELDDVAGLTAQELRKLAADAVAAAEWLEAHA